MNIQLSNVKLIRFAHGEEILAEVLEDGLMKVVFKKPIQVVLIPNRSTPENPTIGFGPWGQFSSSDTFEVDKSHVLVIMSPIKEFVEQYVSVHSAVKIQPKGLILPNKG